MTHDEIERLIPQEMVERLRELEAKTAELFALANRNLKDLRRLLADAQAIRDMSKMVRPEQVRVNRVGMVSEGAAC